LIYDPHGYKGYLGNAIANKRQNKFGSTSGRKRKAAEEEEEAAVENRDGELSEDDARALQQLLQIMNVR
jgi:hypothetical protein